MINQHKLAFLAKKLIFGKKEFYNFSTQRLSFLTGTRPIKRKYIDAKNDVVRNDVLQIEYFEKYFKKDDVLWDIGSHHGHYSIFAASIADKSGQVYSFEPDKDAMRIQQKNIALNHFERKIIAADIAVSDKDGFLQFNAMSGNSQSHISKNPGVEDGNVVSVPTKTLNSLLKELPQPSFIKIDTEGAEIDILRSASDLLSNRSIKFICELHPFAWKSFQVQYKEFEEILKHHNRKISLIDPKKSLVDLPYYGTVLF